MKHKRVLIYEIRYVFQLEENKTIKNISNGGNHWRAPLWSPYAISKVKNLTHLSTNKKSLNNFFMISLFIYISHYI